MLSLIEKSQIILENINEQDGANRTHSLLKRKANNIKLPQRVLICIIY
jgi:hypothetical protein